MNIHTVKEGETLAEIGKMYGTCADMIKRDNGLTSDVLIVGEELVILTPTRTYLPRKNDSLPGICHRFGIGEEYITAANPNLQGGGLGSGEIALKYPPAPYGSAASNGCCYAGCPIEMVRAALPYLTYLTCAAAKVDKSGIRRIFDGSKYLELIKGTGIIPLLKIFDEREESDRYEGAETGRFADLIITEAKDMGYSGIVLDLCSPNAAEGSIAGALIELRKRMMGQDMILIIDADENTPLTAGDYSDGCILSLPFGKGFRDSVQEIANRYAKESESGRTFLELPVFALAGEEFLPICDALNAARSGRATLEYSDEEKCLTYEHGRRGRVKIPSLNYIKSMFGLIHELDYMGVSFDIGRVPISYLVMYNSLFKTVRGG